ncbi:MAG: cobalamin B12-binding domain-containing protein [Candidatus Helarchaeota archaeon]
MSENPVIELEKSVLELDMDKAIENAKKILDSEGKISIDDAVKAISSSLEKVGKKFQDGEWYLTELVYAAEIAKEVMKLLSPLLEKSTTKKLGTIVIGTVLGDLHDLGKNIFCNYAKSAGFKVIDLGTDVPVEKFIDAIKENNAHIIGMSCLLTATDQQLGKVINELKNQKLRDKVKVIVGGAAITEEFAKSIGADAFAPDAITGLDIVKKWAEYFIPDVDKSS